MNSPRLHSSLFILVLISITVMFSSCIKEDTIDDIIDGGNTSSSNSMTATIDGADYEAVEDDLFGEIEASITTNSVVSTLVMAGVDVSLSAEGSKTIVLTVVNSQNILDLPLNTPITYTQDADGVLMLPAASAGYNVSYTDEEIESIDASSEEAMPNNMVVTFTEIDAENSTVSGTFSFDAKNPDTGITYEIREGVFTEIAF